MIDVEFGPHRYPYRTWSPSMGRVLGRICAIDTETMLIDRDRPWIVPALVVACVFDGKRGFFLGRDMVEPFFACHADLELIMHHAAFDMKVLQLVLGHHRDLYGLVDQGKVWDTLILHRLLSLATKGHTAKGESSLERCIAEHLRLGLPKHATDVAGRDIRTGFGRFLGRMPDSIPVPYLEYAARDSVATWHLYHELKRCIGAVLRGSQDVWGFVSDCWLRDAINRFGPLTHTIQLKASIVMDAMMANGIAVDSDRRSGKLAQVRAIKDAARQRMRSRGFLAGEPGSTKALQSILRDHQRKFPEPVLARTESGQFLTSEEQLAELADVDSFFADYLTYRTAEKLESTYLNKMANGRLHPGFGCLLETGRTYCSGGVNLQGLPRESDESEAAQTIRGCFVPGAGRVFIDADYSQIELVVLAFALQHQFDYGSTLAQVIQSGDDIHNLIAASVLGKSPDEVTKQERSTVKPISFGRPGGMGPDRIRQIALSTYGVELTPEQVQGRIATYERLCPELVPFLEDDHDGVLAIASWLDLTPAAYREATGRAIAHSADPRVPQAWLGGMLLKTLKEPDPATRKGRPYTDDERAFFWDRAQRLAGELKPPLQADLAARRPDRALASAVAGWGGFRPVFTLTGRLRARATFCSSRNCIFQGPAADGAILGLWRIWRSGHKIVNFVHDQVVIEAPADGHLLVRVAEIESMMRQGMLDVVPGMRVKVETVVTRSLNKSDIAEVQLNQQSITGAPPLESSYPGPVDFVSSIAAYPEAAGR